MAIAVIFLFANLVGMGLGPLATGALSDLLRPWAGEDSLRYALLFLCPGYLWIGWQFLEASRTVAHDVMASHPAGTDELGQQPKVVSPISSRIRQRP